MAPVLGPKYEGVWVIQYELLGSNEGSFATGEYGDPMEELVNQNQSGTIDHYHEKFVGILNLLQLDDTCASIICVSNMKLKISQIFKAIYIQVHEWGHALS